MSRFHMKGKALYERIRHLAPIARSSLNATAKRLRIRCLDAHTVEFAATGRHLTVRTYASFGGEMLDDSAAVDADVLYKMIRNLKKRDVELELKRDGELELAAGSVTTTFPNVEGPAIRDELPGDRAFEMPSALFAEAMSQALPYASCDDHRPALCGVFVDLVGGEGNVTATDGHRLFNRAFAPDVWMVDDPLDDGVILPDVAVKYALKLVDERCDVPIEVFVSDDVIVIAQNGVFRIDADRVDANYPDFRQCLPRLTGMPTATFESAALKTALETGAPFVGKSESVKLVYNGSVQLQVDGDAGQFDCDLNGEFEGAAATLSFNHRYLTQACATLEGEIIQFVGDSFDPQIFCDAGAPERRARVVVMPMRP